MNLWQMDFAYFISLVWQHAVIINADPGYMQHDFTTMDNTDPGWLDLNAMDNTDPGQFDLNSMNNTDPGQLDLNAINNTDLG